GFSVYSLPAAAVVLALRYFGIAVAVLMHQRLRQLGHWPAERVFGVPRIAAAVHLRLRPGARAAAVAGALVMLFCMNDHIIPGMLLVSTYGPQVMIQYSALLDAAGAAALAMPVAAVGMGMVALALLVGRANQTRTEHPPAGGAPGRAFCRRLVAAALALAILAAAMATPVIVLAGQAGSWRAIIEALRDARRQIWQTLYVAVAAGAACAALAGLLAGHWVRRRRSGGLTAAPLVLLNLTVPPALLAIGI
ncbi:unnamed protein product, partial [marine sediment metagenome]